MTEIYDDAGVIGKFFAAVGETTLPPLIAAITTTSTIACGDKANTDAAAPALAQFSPQIFVTDNVGAACQGYSGAATAPAADAPAAEAPAADAPAADAPAADAPAADAPAAEAPAADAPAAEAPAGDTGDMKATIQATIPLCTSVSLPLFTLPGQRRRTSGRCESRSSAG